MSRKTFCKVLAGLFLVGSAASIGAFLKTSDGMKSKADSSEKIIWAVCVSCFAGSIFSAFAGGVIEDFRRHCCFRFFRPPPEDAAQSDRSGERLLVGSYAAQPKYGTIASPGPQSCAV